MNARDIMTTKVVSVSPDTLTRDIARLLLDNRISAVPVVDAGGGPVGMVSEGDLIGRDEAAREGRRDWWLEMLAEGETLSPDFLNQLRAVDRKAQDVMTAPVVTVGEKTEIREIARLLATQRIKRVPVISDGRVVGIVSRADLLRALADSQPGPNETKPTHAGSGIFDWIDRHYHGDRRESQAEQAQAKQAQAEQAQAEQAQAEQAQAEQAQAEHQVTAKPTAAADDLRVPAADFRGLVRDFERGEIRHHEDERRAAAERRQQAVAEMIDRHIDDEGWRTMLHNARQAAEHGQTELMLRRFPSQLCSDRGRAVSEAEENWPATLRGEPAELYLRWERDLKPNGFRLAARVLDYPDGKPGDVGLFLVWGE